MQIAVLKVSDYFSPEASTHIEDFDTLFKNVCEEITIKASVFKQTVFELDFAGFTVGDTNYLRNKLDEFSQGKYTINFINVKILALQNTESVYVYEILRLIDGKREISNKEGLRRICALIDDKLKTSDVCELDFNYIVVTINPNTNKPETRITSTGYSICHATTLVVLAKIKALYGDKVIFTGLNHLSEVYVTYASNYFTAPYCETEEQMKQFMEGEYERDDLVFIVKTDFTVDEEVYLESKSKTRKRLKKEVKELDILKHAEISPSNISLGVIGAITNEGVEYFEITIKNAERYLDFKDNGRFKYTINPSPVVVPYSKLMNCQVSIHGAELSDEYATITDILKGYKFNPPKDRKLYYSAENARIYVNNIRKHVPKDSKNLISSKPDEDVLRKINTFKKVYYAPHEQV